MNLPKKVLVIGSCRSALIPSKKFKLVNFLYTHTTKETIQLLKYAYSNIDEQVKIINEKYIFQGMTIEKFNKIKELCENESIILIEISSIKEYSKNGYYYNQWVIRDVIINKEPQLYNTISLYEAKLEDLKNDINIIKNLLPNSMIIFQSHINLDFEGYESFKNVQHIPPIKSRELIDKAINESNQESKYLKLIPREIFKHYKWEEVLKSKDHTCHFSNKGYEIIGKALDEL